MINTQNWFQLRPMYSYIRKQSENEKYMRYLEIGATFSLIALFLFFAIMPTITTIFSLIGEIKSKELFIKKVDAKVNKVLVAQDAYTQVQGKYSLIEDSFPQMASYYQGASNLATIFKESSLNIDQLNFSLGNSDEDQKKSYESYQITISGEGQYNSVMNAIQKILTNRRLIEVGNIQISQPSDKNDNSSGSKTIRINLSSDLYFLPNVNEKN